MATIRIATYNVEWMNNLFVSRQPRIRDVPGKGLGRNPKEPHAVAQRIADVIRDLNADIVGIQEGPARLAQMEHFVDIFLGGEYSVSGVESGSQSIYVLVKRNCPVKAETYEANDAYYQRIKKPVYFQPWGEVNRAQKYTMARSPALLRLTKSADSPPVHIIVAHTKSQFSKTLTKKAFEARERSAMLEAILARQKLSSDVAALRRHVTNVILEKKNAAGVILMGDLNDGFSRSVFEKEFLMQSLVDELRGSFRRQSALLEHVFSEQQLRERDAYTVQFRSAERSGRWTRELIDHILVTPALRAPKFWLRLKPGSGRIAHDISKRHTRGTGSKADDRPSDHMPVYADFTLR